MKIRVLLISIVILTMCVGIFAQNSAYLVSSKKVTYERKGENISEYKKKFNVNYPKVSGVSSKAAQKNLDDTLNYWKTFGMTLEESLGDYTWLDSFDYKVNYNKNSLLAIELIMEGSGAYPDGTVKTKVINLNTGRRIYIQDAFTNIGKLLVKIEKAQKKELADHIKNLQKEYPEDYATAQDLFRNKKFTTNTLDEYSIDEKGVTFIFDYGFPHAIKALEPDGKYFFTWQEMKPFIKTQSFFGKFIK